MTWYFWVWGGICTLCTLIWAACGVEAIMDIREARANRRKGETLRCQLEDARNAERTWKREYESLMELYHNSQAKVRKMEKRLNEFGPLSP